MEYENYPLLYTLLDHSVERHKREVVRVCIGCHNIMWDFKFISITEYFNTIST